MDKTTWLKIAAGFSLFMTVCQTAISLSPALAAYFMAPPELLKNRLLLFVIGEGAAVVLVVFALYALSGAGSIRRLPLLRFVLVSISTILVLRGLFIVLTVLHFLRIVEGRILLQGVISTLIFLAAGIAYSVGTASNWGGMRIRG